MDQELRIGPFGIGLVQVDAFTTAVVDQFLALLGLVLDRESVAKKDRFDGGDVDGQGAVYLVGNCEWNRCERRRA